ncbi:peptide ABC transporter substrate-binding protein [Telmatospirillum siberiense]|uniref:Peptide ABC transporter n=1 Tax=Telmatospirillum siberiense TaxID=382514 RepID=A0A2N3PQC6_9PROT|nr:peptide ABC transporter substrate-binding protein [Telmatospirillum siberiense]PKU22609.1 peptide ABC transporter [Telmatospirillum siberiense]
MWLRRQFAASLLISLLAWLPGPAFAETNQLVIGLSQFPTNFNPLIDTTVAKSYVLGLARRPLTLYDKDWRLVCMLCTELPTIENGQAVIEPLPDGGKGIAVTYRIQPEARWGDGVPVSSEDIVFSWTVGRHPESGVSHGEMFRRIRAIDVTDAKTFTVHLNKVTFDYNAINDFEVLPAHLEKEAFRTPAGYKTNSRYETDVTNPGLYFGPYRPTNVVRGQFIVFEPNPTWYGNKPAFAKIIVKVIESTPSLEANLLSGDIDMVAGELGMTVDGAVSFERRKRPEWVVVYKPTLFYEQITVNVENPILADRRVRQALLYGLDRAGIVRQIFQGKQPVADSDVSPMDWSADPGIKTYPFDPKKAADLLDAAGWTPGTDGTRRNAKGDKLAVELMTTAGNRNREAVELVAQQAWKRLGIDVTLRNQPARTFFGETVLRHAFPSLALFAWSSYPESLPRTTLASDMAPVQANNFAGQNTGGYKNPEMDHLLDAIEGELDKERRRVLWHQLQALYAEDLPALPLTFHAVPFVLPKWLKGVEPTGTQYPTTLWAENWRAEK